MERAARKYMEASALYERFTSVHQEDLVLTSVQHLQLDIRMLTNRNENIAPQDIGPKMAFYF
jgi:hypothetical protein